MTELTEQQSRATALFLRVGILYGDKVWRMHACAMDPDIILSSLLDGFRRHYPEGQYDLQMRDGDDGKPVCKASLHVKLRVLTGRDASPAIAFMEALATLRSLTPEQEAEAIALLAFINQQRTAKPVSRYACERCQDLKFLEIGGSCPDCVAPVAEASAPGGQYLAGIIAKLEPEQARPASVPVVCSTCQDTGVLDNDEPCPVCMCGTAEPEERPGASPGGASDLDATPTDAFTDEDAALDVAADLTEQRQKEAGFDIFE